LWSAVYSGDGNNQGAADKIGRASCRDREAGPAINTVAGGTVVIGGGAKLSDTANLTGGFNPTGTVTFYLFAPGVTPNATYSNNVYTDVVTVSGNGSYDTSTGTKTGGYTPTATGTYLWSAVYSGDGNNQGAAD